MEKLVAEVYTKYGKMLIDYDELWRLKEYTYTPSKSSRTVYMVRSGKINGK